MISKQLATIIKRAADLREGSYDDKASDLALSNVGAVGVDFNKFYKMSMLDAAKKACAEYNEPDLATLIESMLSNMWNQSLEWTQDI